MNALFTVLIWVIVVAVIATAYTFFDDWVVKRTRVPLSEWVPHAFSMAAMLGVGALIAYGAYRLGLHGVQADEPFPIYLSLILFLISGFLIWTALKEFRDPGYHPTDRMAGKKRHYDKDGNLKGYSDPD